MFFGTALFAGLDLAVLGLATVLAALFFAPGRYFAGLAVSVSSSVAATFLPRSSRFALLFLAFFPVLTTAHFAAHAARNAMWIAVTLFAKGRGQAGRDSGRLRPLLEIGLRFGGVRAQGFCLWSFIFFSAFFKGGTVVEDLRCPDIFRDFQFDDFGGADAILVDGLGYRRFRFNSDGRRGLGFCLGQFSHLFGSRSRFGSSRGLDGSGGYPGTDLTEAGERMLNRDCGLDLWFGLGFRLLRFDLGGSILIGVVRIAGEYFASDSPGRTMKSSVREDT